MLSIPTVALVVFYVYVRPHEFSQAFKFLTVYAVVAMIVFSLLIDLRVGVNRLRGSPLLALLTALAAWSIFTIAVKQPEQIGVQVASLAISLIAFVLVSEGVQSLRAFEAAAIVLLTITIALSAMGVHQRMGPPICYRITVDIGANSAYTAEFDVADGRSCTTRQECYEGEAIPGADYLCEHGGVLNAHTIGGRVRFRGILEDPNELAWAVLMGMPLALGLYERKRSGFRLGVLVVTIVLGSICIVLTQSRSGQIGLLCVIGVYFVRRFKTRGLIAALVAGMPIFLLGGRSGEGAESSSIERLGCWNESLALWRESPFIGVGSGQFVQHHYLTAHNSFLLALGELGPVGLLLWTTSVYYAMKICVRAQVELADRPEARVARIWSMSLLASLTGLAVPAIFLSLTYHTILWLYLGLAGALYTAIRKHEPKFRVTLGWRDLVGLVVGNTLIIIFIAVYARIKLH